MSAAASRSFAIKPFNFLLVCNVVLGLGIRRVAYLQWLHTLTLFAAQSAVLHTAPCLHTFCTFLHCRAQLQTACILGRGTRGRGRGVLVMWSEDYTIYIYTQICT